MLRSTLHLLTVASVLLSFSASVMANDNVASQPSAALKAEQLKMQARIAAEQGDFTTAVQNIRSAAELTGDRTTANRAQQVMPQPAGGNPFANFSEIMLLIQQQTSPPAKWFDVDGEGGQLSISQQGVFVAAPAVLAALKSITDDSHLLKAAELARQANHNADVRTMSSLRMVSLPRLEAYVTRLITNGHAIPDDVRTLAGLSRIDFLFVFPETSDIVIAGPAGDWTQDSTGRTVSVDNQRPTLNLDDLVTLTRTFSRNGTHGFLCTIDPKQTQVAAVQEFVNTNRRSLKPSTAAAFTKELEQRLGLQNVIVQGVPHDSRIASVIVEADYRMKEIGIGKRQGPEGMKSYFDLMTRSEQRGSGSMTALRWWMAVGYDAVNRSPAGNVYEFAGNAIQCLSEDQVVGHNGTRQATGKASLSNAKFAELFTRHLPELARQDVVFADLENVFDLAMVSALVHSHGLAQQSGWTPGTFSDRGEFQTRPVDVPKELMTAAHFRVFNGNSVVIQVAGGVRADLSELLNDKSRMKTVEALAGQSKSASPLGQQNNRWWWDAAQK
ncbi:MAG: DUF1598 domain-containing protein [Planctomycetaceae bacterium]